MGELAARRSGLEQLETMLRYLTSASDAVDDQDLQKALAAALPGTGETIMPTLAEKWIQQGVQRGLQQGLEQGLQQGLQQGETKGEAAILVRLLELKFGSLSPKSVFEKPEPAAKAAEAVQIRASFR
jgi:hypothetical protein